MNKNELVHTHSLLLLVRARAERRGDVGPDAFEAYESLDVTPTQLYKPKADHERAVLLLAELLADQLAINGKYRDDGVSQPLTANR